MAAVALEALLPELSPYQVLDESGTVVGVLPELEPEAVLAMYRTLRLVRVLDDRMMILQRQGRIGFYGACSGQEAVPVGTAAALRSSDWVFPALREGAVLLHRGYDLERYICQVFGNAGDALRGRQMPSHYADRDKCVVSWSSCIGNQVPQAVGMGLAAQRAGDGVVTAAFMGDGATSEPDIHTAMHFAQSLRAPTVFICQNNHWSISVPTERQTRVRTLAERALAYGMPHARVDGNDIFAVYAAVTEASERARSGGGPTFLEMLTYRIGAHSSSDDPRVYRDDREVELWKQRDPIQRLRAYLVASGLLTAADDEALTTATEQTVLETVRRAEAWGEPPLESLFEDVYAIRPWHLEEQRVTCLSFAAQTFVAKTGKH